MKTTNGTNRQTKVTATIIERRKIEVEAAINDAIAKIEGNVEKSVLVDALNLIINLIQEKKDTGTIEGYGIVSEGEALIAKAERLGLVRYVAGTPYVRDLKKEKCSACSGSGYYDVNGSPACGICNGTGEELN